MNNDQNEIKLEIINIENYNDNLIVNVDTLYFIVED